MIDFFIKQITDFNMIQFAAIIFFVVTFQKSNTTKLLDKQTQEFHMELHEIKEDILRGVEHGPIK